MSVGRALEMRPIGSNESSKSSSSDDGEERDEQVRDPLVANEEAIKIPAKNDGRDERFGKDGQYPKRERCPPGEWYKYHILLQQGEKRINMTFLDDHLNLCKALRSEDTIKWKTAMQKKYTSFTTNGRW